MRKIFTAAVLSLFILPVFAADYSVPSVESVKSFSSPYDSRIHYSLPEGKNMSVFGRRNDTPNETSNFDDDEDVVLDTSNIQPQKKIIKKISSDSPNSQNNIDNTNVPMNYNSFPKFYDANDMMNQQFMPMMNY